MSDGSMEHIQNRVNSDLHCQSVPTNDFKGQYP